MQPNPQKCVNITRNVLGCKTLGEILSERHAIANNIKVGGWIDHKITDIRKEKNKHQICLSQLKSTVYLKGLVVTLIFRGLWF